MKDGNTGNYSDASEVRAAEEGTAAITSSIASESLTELSLLFCI